MWKQVAESGAWLSKVRGPSKALPHRARMKDAFGGWISSSVSQRDGLMRLLDQVRGHLVATGGTDADSMMRYDRQRVAKESLIEKIIATAVETTDASRMLLGVQLAFFQSPQEIKDNTTQAWWQSHDSISLDDRYSRDTSQRSVTSRCFMFPWPGAGTPKRLFLPDQGDGR
jgi:hypothetical protein